MPASHLPDVTAPKSELAADACAQELTRLRRRLDRERSSRLEAETIAENGLRELYAKQQELQLLEQIATAANQTISIRDVFQYALTQVCEFMGWPVGHVYLLDRTSHPQRLRSMAIWHEAHPERNAEFRLATEATEFAPDIGLPGRVQTTARPVWLNDVVDDANFPRMRSARQCGLKAACAFPVLTGQEVVAVLEFFAEKALEPDQRQMRLMAQIGVQLGRVIERRYSEDQLIHDASHDPLTGLPNRALFRDRLNQVFARSKRGKAGFAVLFIDLDRFKLVNDSLGHLAGDTLIVEVAARLQACLRREDTMVRASSAVEGENTLARLGGDEFTILLTDIRDPTDAIRVADRIQEALLQSFTIEGQEIYTSASIGVATSAANYRSADDVLRDADLAMYRAKAMGKARSELYDQTMHLVALKRLQLETDLRQALQNSEFVLQYQPIMSLKDQKLTGFEALVRWRRPGCGLVPPGDFIPVAEETGLIVPLGLWVLREACRTTRRWQQEFPQASHLTISINLSARQFTQPDLVEQVRRVIEEVGIDPRTVRLEVTESVTMGNAERAIRVLSQLKQLGVRLSLDDFGTGYSSLSYLQRFPLDVLKIDRSFISAMSHSPESLQIVNTILNLARNLGMDVVAEGTEREAEVTQLKAMGCDFGQGYFFSKPVDATAVTSLLRHSDGFAPARQLNGERPEGHSLESLSELEARDAAVEGLPERFPTSV
ncbi:MAG: EAL domain-containing protein [Acidisphaera sp.]|nr:EAL domain-containing protein [Acidisphaera sp.]